MQVIVLTLLSCLLVACNGASGENGSDPFNPDNSATASVKIGHFNAQGQFVEGQMGVSLEMQNGAVIISAGASLGLNLALVDDDNQAISDTATVSFSSVCVDNLQASMNKEVSLKNGQASTTFTDISCAGASGTREVITASVTISGETLSVSQEIDIQAEALGSISFSSAVPESIVLIGNGAQNTSTLSVLTFQVNGALGNPLSGQLVEFSLSTAIGGLSLLSDSGFTGANGQVSTQVSAGNVPTSVRVTASTQGANGELMQSQSNLLIVSTGLGDQDSFSLATDIFNPEADNVDGQQVTLTARLADTFNNPVVNGTAISFTTEGGVIQPSCTTVDGACSVIWTSASPRVSDHRITILATAIGHETLYDSNGNNSFDDADGGAILDGKDNGLEHGTFEQSGFVDHSEAWRDDDEDGQRDPAEIFLDYNNNQQFD